MRVDLGNRYQEFMERQRKVSGNMGFSDILSSKTCVRQQKMAHAADAFQKEIESPYLNYSKYSITSSNFNIETENYKISQDETSGYITVYDKKADAKVVMHSSSDLAVQKDASTGTKVLINDFGNGFFRVVRVSEELEGALKEALNTDVLTEKELSGFQVHTDQITGIHYITADGFESRGGTLLLDDDGRKKLTSLAEDYMKQYPQLLKSMDEAIMYAAFEVRGMAKRIENGIMMLGPNSLSFYNKNGVDGWRILFEEQEYEIFRREWDAQKDVFGVESMGEWQRKCPVKYAETINGTHE